MRRMPEHHHDWTGRRVLVTGGAGFIGTHLVNRLAAAGCLVRVLDDLSTGSPTWADGQVEFIEGCVTSRATLQRAAGGCEVLFHLAAMVSAPECEQSPERCHQINVEATATAADVAGDIGATIVFTSSCALYGADTPLPCAESARPSPISVYGSSKARAEAAIESRRAEGGLQATPLRLFNVVGGGQRPDVPYAAVVPIFAAALCAGRPLHIHGDGLQTRDFIPVDLAIEAMLRAAARPCNQPINVASGRQTSLLELITMLSAASGRVAERVHGQPRPEDIRHSVGDTSLLESCLGLPGRWGCSDALFDAIASVVDAIAGSDHAAPPLPDHTPKQ
jgi:UDP-glucose 4-epimerase